MCTIPMGRTRRKRRPPTGRTPIGANSNRIGPKDRRAADHRGDVRHPEESLPLMDTTSRTVPEGGRSSPKGEEGRENSPFNPSAETRRLGRDRMRHFQDIPKGPKRLLHSKLHCPRRQLLRLPHRCRRRQMRSWLPQSETNTRT